MKKVIFLDIDGVLRPFKYTEACEKIYFENPECKTRDEYGYYFAPWALDALRFILASEPDAKIVISSDWRKNGLEAIKEMWNIRKLPGLDKLVGITPILETTRGHEITAWLNQNKKVTRYVIIDDHCDMGLHNAHLVQTNNKYGLTMSLTDKIINILHVERVTE